MYRLLSKDPLSEMYVLNLIVKLMVHFNTIELDLSELPPSELLEALQAVSDDNTSAYLNYQTGAIHTRTVGVDYPLLQLGTGVVTDASNWYQPKATRKLFSNYFNPRTPKPIPVQAMLSKAILYAYYAGSFTVDRKAMLTYTAPGVTTDGIRGAIRYLVLKPRDARLVLRDIILHTDAVMEKRIALKALQLQTLLSVTEFNDHLLGGIPWGLIHQIAKIH